MGVVMIQSYK